jgi:gas vesicle protein
MSQENPYPMGPMLLTFLAGAAVGAVVVALTTPKTGPELRGNMKDLALRAKDKAGDLAANASGAWDELKGRTGLATDDLKRGMADAANDFKRGVTEASNDVRS